MSEATAGLRARWLQLSGNGRGALWMIASGLGFSVMAAGIKLLGHRLDSFQIGFFRVVIGFLAILPFVIGGGPARLRLCGHLKAQVPSQADGACVQLRANSRQRKTMRRAVPKPRQPAGR